MPTLILDPPPAELEALLERRRRTGADRNDEVWEGVYHMVPGPGLPHSLIGHEVSVALAGPAHAAGLHVSLAFNLGDSNDDFRVPDLGVHRELRTGAWTPTAAIVVEILSPEDEARQKLPFYAARGVEEVLIVDPAERSVAWLALRDGEYRPVDRSEVVDVSASELGERIEWPDL
jgi:Uma2 family endonuclease